MKKIFKDRIEAIEWIANYVETEGQFEVLRERLNFNHIYTGTFFLDLDRPIAEVSLKEDKGNGNR